MHRTHQLASAISAMPCAVAPLVSSASVTWINSTVDAAWKVTCAISRPLSNIVLRHGARIAAHRESVLYGRPVEGVQSPEPHQELVESALHARP